MTRRRRSSCRRPSSRFRPAAPRSCASASAAPRRAPQPYRLIDRGSARGSASGQRHPRRAPAQPAALCERAAGRARRPALERRAPGRRPMGDRGAQRRRGLGPRRRHVSPRRRPASASRTASASAPCCPAASAAGRSATRPRIGDRARFQQILRTGDDGAAIRLRNASARLGLALSLLLGPPRAAAEDSPATTALASASASALEPGLARRHRQRPGRHRTRRVPARHRRPPLCRRRPPARLADPRPGRWRGAL